MSDITNIPLEDNFEATITQKLEGDASALTIYCSAVPSATIPVGQKIRVTINPKKGFTKLEEVLVESIDTAAKTMTIASGGRAQDRYNGDSPTALEHVVGSKIIISNPYGLWDEVQTSNNSKMDKSGGTFTGAVDFSGASATFRLPNLTTAQRDALASPQNGMKIYNTTTGTEQVYDGGAWQDVLTGGGSTPNASTTVAGIAEEATDAEVGASTGTGGTGARLFVNPTSVVKTSSGAGDENKLAALDSSGKFAAGFVDYSQNTTGVKYFVATAGETIDGTTTPVPVYISDGTGGRTQGRIYKSDANDATNGACHFVGFVNQSVTAGNSVNVYFAGVMPGFSGLARGREYFLSATVGTIQNSITNPAFTVGQAVSTTEILIRPKNKFALVTTSTALTVGTVPLDVTITLGFTPQAIIAFSNTWPGGTGTAANHAILLYAGLTSGLGYLATDGQDADGIRSGTGFRIMEGDIGDNDYFFMVVQSISQNAVTVRWDESSSPANLTADVNFLIFG